MSNRNKNERQRKYSQYQFERTTCGSSIYNSEQGQGKNLRKGSTDFSCLTNYKTQVCKYWETGQKCPFAENCVFAHGQNQMRSKDGICQKYKTKLCKKYHQQGYCLYGKRCQFIHSNPSSSSLMTQMFIWFVDEPNYISMISNLRVGNITSPQKHPIIGWPQSSSLTSLQKYCEHNQQKVQHASQQKYMKSLCILSQQHIIQQSVKEEQGKIRQSQNKFTNIEFGFTKPRLYSI